MRYFSQYVESIAIAHNESMLGNIQQGVQQGIAQTTINLQALQQQFVNAANNPSAKAAVAKTVAGLIAVGKLPLQTAKLMFQGIDKMADFEQNLRSSPTWGDLYKDLRLRGQQELQGIRLYQGN